MKKHKIGLFLLLQFVFCFSMHSQDHAIDSLTNALKTAKEDTSKLNILIDISNICSEEDILKYAQPASVLAQKLLSDPDKKISRKAKKAFGDACNNIGYAYQSLGDISSSLIYYQKSLNIRTEINDKTGIGECLNNIAYTLEHKGDIPKALEYYHKALENYEAVGDKRGMAYAYNNIGYMHHKQEDLSKAIEYYKKSMRLREEVGDRHGLSQSLTNIGSVYKTQKNYQEALKIHLKSLIIQTELGDKSGISNSYNNIGFIYENEFDYEIFNYVRDRLISSVSQDGAQDGMDGILICFDKASNRITYSASHNIPVLIRENKLIKLSADKMPIGKGEKDAAFNLYTIGAEKGDMLYLYTDGYPDQFGGPKGKKFKYNQLNELLLRNSEKEAAMQKEILLLAFVDWKGKMEQVDDILIIGIKI